MRQLAYFDLPALAAAPAAPAAGYSRVYADSTGVLHDLTSGAVDTALGAAGAMSVYKLAADQAVTAVTATSVTGLAHPVAANGAYEFEGMVFFTSAVTTTGFAFGFTGPASPTRFFATLEFQTAATTWSTLTLQALGLMTVQTATYAATPTIVACRIKGLFGNGANAGTLQLTAASEVAGSAITVLRGSTLKIV